LRRRTLGRHRGARTPARTCGHTASPPGRRPACTQVRCAAIRAREGAAHPRAASTHTTPPPLPPSNPDEAREARRTPAASPAPLQCKCGAYTRASARGRLRRGASPLVVLPLRHVRALAKGALDVGHHAAAQLLVGARPPPGLVAGKAGRAAQRLDRDGVASQQERRQAGARLEQARGQRLDAGRVGSRGAGRGTAGEGLEAASAARAAPPPGQDRPRRRRACRLHVTHPKRRCSRTRAARPRPAGRRAGPSSCLPVPCAPLAPCTPHTQHTHTHAPVVVQPQALQLPKGRDGGGDGGQLVVAGVQVLQGGAPP
jgi:hypothetical protein